MENFKPVKKAKRDFKPVKRVVAQEESSTWKKVVPEILASLFRGQMEESEFSKKYMPSGARAISNIPSSAYEYGKQIGQAIRHPVQTLKGMGQLGAGLVEKIPGGRYLTPGSDYTQVGEPDERAEAVDAVINMYKEKFGSIEGFKKAVEENPVEVLGDIATALTIGGKLAGFTKTGKKLTEVGAIMEPLNVATAPLRAAKKIIPEELPSRLYTSAMKFTASLTKNEIDSLVRTGLDTKTVPTYRSLRKLNLRINALNDQVQDLIDSSVAKGRKVPVEILFRDLDALKREAMSTYGFGTLKPSIAIRTIDNIKKQMIDANKKIGREFLTIQEVQTIKQNIYSDMSKFYAEAAKSPVPVVVQKTVARTAKEVIEKFIPEVKQLNKTEGEYIALMKEVERTASRLSKADMINFKSAVTPAFGGAVFGKLGVVGGMAIGVVDRPVVKAHLAILLKSMKDKGMSVRVTPTIARLIAYEAGQITEELEEQ